MPKAYRFHVLSALLFGWFFGGVSCMMPTLDWLWRIGWCVDFQCKVGTLALRRVVARLGDMSLKRMTEVAW